MEEAEGARERVRPPREQSEVKRRASGRGLQVWLLLASAAGGDWLRAIAPAANQETRRDKLSARCLASRFGARVRQGLPGR